MRGFIGRSRSFTISGSGSTAWTHYDHPISIRGPRFAPIFISPWRRVELSEASDLHQRGNAWSYLARQIFIRSRSSLNGKKIKTRSRRDRGPIVIRSGRDRGPIAARSWPRSSAIMASFIVESMPHSFIAESMPHSFQLNRTTIDWEPRSRSTHDRGLIAARSSRDRGFL